MDALIPAIVEVQPTEARLAPLIDRHLTLMRASSPACSVHAMDGTSLAEAGARFFAMFEGGTPIAMGALKAINADHAELKSMHVVPEARGRGLARAMVRHLVGVARAAGHGRVSLETGSQAVFAPARALYAAEGFDICPPFEGYGPDPNSAFMTRVL